ncbi:hypothetical protein NSK_003700 [Nannochloropsis salina CCMP1776]|uniref:ABC-2 type transporter transmembrane domain-containing protein n=1 Tax=Nannochloropsis salina CCMP1776 TaxID=1027361 RepID=A0A4D9D4G3_9STRA|nr:hypothetical protein NSK_003700 [Nannochloropsis salina CCMP1776]|eukprot:TFJ85277.1 hypothetical protein NSK_003700 [Nannochloropsis salina CCMP1776]
MALEMETSRSPLKAHHGGGIMEASPGSYDCESQSMDGWSSDSVDSSAPHSYMWRDIRCSYDANMSGRGGKQVEIEVRKGEREGMEGRRELEHAAALFRASNVDALAPNATPPPLVVPRHQSLCNDVADTSLRTRSTCSIRAVDSWFWKFRVVLRRNFTNYYRNPGNVLARVTVMLVIAGLEALVYFRIGSREAGSTSLLAVTHILGSIFYSILAVTLLPFASLSLFIYERQFYSGEAASKLYPCSAYFVSNIVLETLLNSFSGFLYSIIVYYNLDYVAFTQPRNVPLNFLVYLTGLILQTNMGSMCVQLAALLAPNQDIAFVLAAGYVAASILTGGFIVSFNSFYRYSKWLQWTSFIKFTFQPLSMNVLRGTNVEFVIDYLPLNTPGTILENFGCALAIYLGLTIAAYLALRHLHKERR